MADAIEVYLDLSTPLGGLFRSLNSLNPFEFTKFYQGSALQMRVFPVVPTGSTQSPPFFSLVPLDNIEFEMVVGPRAGTTAILAAQYDWSKQIGADAEGKQGYFYATLDLHTTEMNAAIGTADSITRYIEFRLARLGGNFGPVAQGEVTIIATVKDPGASASIPTPAPSYLTAAQCLSMFVAWRNDLIAANAGRTVVYASADSTATREMGVANDKSPIDNTN